MTSHFPFTDDSLYREQPSSEMSFSRHPALHTTAQQPSHIFGLEIHTNNTINHTTMNDGSNDSLASGDQVAAGTSALPTLAHLGHKAESEQQSLYGKYIRDNNRHAALMVDRDRALSKHDTPFVYRTAKLMKALEPGYVQTAMKHAILHSDISAAADKFTGGQDFDTSIQRIGRLNSLMADSCNLAIVDGDMTAFLSKRHTALDEMKPDKPFLTDKQIDRQERFAEDVIGEMSACASTALTLLSKEPSLADVSNQGRKHDTPESLHLRLLELYANPGSMTCGTAREFLKAIYSKFDPATTECVPAFKALKSYSDVHTTAAKKAVPGPLDSAWLLRNWPQSFKPDLDRYPSKLRGEILEVSHLIRGSKAGDQYEMSEDRQKTDNELLGDAIEATRKPDPTIPGDDERWFREVGSRLLPSVSPSDSGHSQSTPPSDSGSPSIPPSGLGSSPNSPPSGLGSSNIPPFDLGLSQNIPPPELEHSQKIPPLKPLKSSKTVDCSTINRSQITEADKESLKTCV